MIGRRLLWLLPGVGLVLAVSGGWADGDCLR